MLKQELKYITTEQLRNSGRLSARAANICICSELDNLERIIHFYDNNKSAKILNYRGMGPTTFKEIQQLCEKTLAEISDTEDKKIAEELYLMESLLEMNEEERLMLKAVADLILEKEAFFLQRNIEYGMCNNEFVADFYDRYCHLPMLWLLEQVTNTSDDRVVVLLKKIHKVFNDQEVGSFAEIGEEMNISAERVRQLHRSIFRQFVKQNIEKASRLFYNLNDWVYLYEAIKGKLLLTQDSPEITEIMERERTNLSPEFVMEIIAYLTDYSVFGGLTEKDNESIWINTVLVKHEYTYMFEFEKFIILFSNYLDKNTENHYIKIEDFIEDHDLVNPPGMKKLNEINELAIEILDIEFGIYPGDNNLIFIPKNPKLKKQHKEEKPQKQKPAVIKPTGKGSKPKLPFLERLNILIAFIERNKHFPFCSSADRVEAALYKWWQKALTDLVHKQDFETQQLFNDFKIKYSKYETSRYDFEWNKNYERYKQYLQLNHHQPTAKENHFLYAWFIRSTYIMKKNRFDKDRQKKMADLKKLISKFQLSS
ncbi:MAG: hypothetical protein LBR18_09085 [Tannerella sp.]|jgi:hypothetical protein|nr:hypothetical protein [Tannerella sp.]